MKETFIKAIGYEGLYEIGSFGNIKSCAKSWVCGDKNSVISKPETILKPFTNGRGYLCVKLLRKTFKIHRLVATHYLPNPLNKREVNHRYGNKKDNRASELEWATAKENTNHAIDSGLRSRTIIRDISKVSGSKNRLAKKIHQLDENGDVINTFDCIADASLFMSGKKTSTISNHLIGAKLSAYGYKWRYAS